MLCTPLMSTVPPRRARLLPPGPVVRRRNDIWLELHDEQGLSCPRIALAAGRTDRAVRAGVAEARARREAENDARSAAELDEDPEVVRLAEEMLADGEYSPAMKQRIREWADAHRKPAQR